MKLLLPSLFLKKGSSDHYYLALLLEEEKVVAVVTQEKEGSLHTLGTSEETLPTHLELMSYEALLDTLDKTISRAEEKLPGNIETEKTIFGVKDSWVIDKKISKEKLTLLKKLCDALSLQPIGFMVLSEAIAHLLNKEEGAPLSAIIAQISKSAITVNLYRGGKVIETHTDPIESSPVKSVDTALHHFTIDVLPSRIIIINNTPEELSQSFINHHFSKSLPFLHVPQISLLPSDFEARAMVHGAGEQMGFQVIEQSSLKATTLPIAATDHDSHVKIEEKSLSEEIDELEKTHNDKLEETTDSTDIHITSPKISDEALMNDGDNFGFVLDQDITKVAPAPVSHTPLSTPPTTRIHTDSPIISTPTRAQASIPSDSEPKGNMLDSIKNMVPSINISFFKNKFVIIVIAVLVLLIASVVWYQMMVKASVTLNIQTEAVDESENITFGISSANDFSQGVIGAREVEVELEGEVSTDATGKKAVGEKAKGTITLYNKNEAKRTISVGTVLKSSNNVEFLTEKEVSVASASGDISGTKAGTTQVAVVAKELGTQGNLPSNTEFTIAGASNLAGKNESAFSGGTKKDVTVVSKKDTDKLLADLTKSLTDKARSEMGSQISGEDELLPDFTGTEVVKKKFDNDVDDEAKKVTLNGTVSFTTYAYTKKDLEEFAQSKLKGDSAEANLSSNIDLSLEDIDLDEDEVSATLLIKGGLLPKIDIDELKKRLTGKSFSTARSIAMDTPQVTDVEIVFSPNIPFIPKILPRITKNIGVTVAAHD